MTGILTSYDEGGNHLKIMSSKGLLGESLKLNEAAYKKKEKDKYLYRMLQSGQKITTDNTLLNPIRIKNSRAIAILEVLPFIFFNSKISLGMLIILLD
jgi:hypothetical protein